MDDGGQAANCRRTLILKIQGREARAPHNPSGRRSRHAIHWRASGSENCSALTKSWSVSVRRKALVAAFSVAVGCRLIRPAAPAPRLSASTIRELSVLLFLRPLS
jgi:hypothetical protein